ncbi:hypothetical protein [Conexibacter sp. CPCC 206217]|uniref:hypothetical protein n=1 Tax=Conexibacter sp. CPCC 206217 TaxID=3064574 RepID=UPI0027270E17|nr:hypothetical protein [Conexibacter sp. CPCC 206217]MDO8208964.1 hypothetical protein [Conexibacter sp. CPCC 206217]
MSEKRDPTDRRTEERPSLPRLDQALALIGRTLVTGNVETLRAARDILEEELGMLDAPDPLSIAGVPYVKWPPRGYTWQETASAYCGWNDRWIVSLIVSYGEDDADGPLDSARRALDLTRDVDRGGTRWFAFDRLSGQMRVYAQHELEPPADPLPDAVA